MDLPGIGQAPVCLKGKPQVLQYSAGVDIIIISTGILLKAQSFSGECVAWFFTQIMCPNYRITSHRHGFHIRLAILAIPHPTE